MVDNFFNKAKKKEQNRRHLNLILTICSIKILDKPEIMNRIMNIRNAYGYKSVFTEFYENHLSHGYRSFLDYLKNRFEIDDETYQGVIGFKEILPDLKTPGGYTQEEDFRLIIHMYLIDIIYKFNHAQNMFCSNIVLGFNYTPEQLSFIISIINKYFSPTINYKNIIDLEELVKNDFIFKYKKFPPLSHG